MRFYFVLEYLSGRGGVETVLKETLILLEEKGHQTKVFLPGPSQYTEWENELSSVEYYDSERATYEDINLVSRILGLSKTFARLDTPDVLIATHVPHTALYSRMAIGKHAETPIVSWLHSPLNNFNNIGFIHYADLHWTISKYITDEIKQTLYKKVDLNYIGNIIKSGEKRVEISESNHYIYIGRLNNREKRIDLLFKSLSLLEFDWKLDLYGDGEDKQQLIELATELNIIGNIEFKGWKENPWDEISEAKALLLTSQLEGFGLVIGEALSRGVPVISSNVTGPRDLIEDDYNGWLFEVNNVDDLAIKLSYLHSLSFEKLRRISDQTMLSVENFSPKNILHRMRDSLIDFINEEEWNV